MKTRSDIPQFFFSKAERARIETAIAQAERATTAEIRVHVQSAAPTGLMTEAAQVFEKLGMTRTAARNGVLVFFAVSDHAFTVIGDEGINSKVPEGFWDDVVGVMVDFFKADRFADGLIAAVKMIGEKLARFFPGHAADVNELADIISFGA